MAIWNAGICGELTASIIKVVIKDTEVDIKNEIDIVDLFYTFSQSVAERYIEISPTLNSHINTYIVTLKIELVEYDTIS